jgi:dUTP pyrophosphatase
LKYYSQKYDLIKGTDDSAGYDLPFYDENCPEITIQPGESAHLLTGVHPEIPQGWVGLLDTRSGTSKYKLDILCRVIDSDFRGNMQVRVINLNSVPVTVKEGQYIAQMVVVPHLMRNPERVGNRDELSDTTRGENGFNHTGRGLSND